MLSNHLDMRRCSQESQGTDEIKLAEGYEKQQEGIPQVYWSEVTVHGVSTPSDK